jgi:Plasma-membrane choline transporter
MYAHSRPSFSLSSLLAPQVVGTWWWVPSEANSFWSTALSDSLVRATTYSFGSICLGSLLVAIVQALRALERHSRNNDDLQFLSCIIQCILACIEGIIESLNRWAYGKSNVVRFDDMVLTHCP